MKRFSALIAIALAVGLTAPSAARAQQPVPGAQPPVVSPQPAPLIGATNQTPVYGWVDSCGQIIPYSTYSVPYQPVYVRYSYQTPCSTVYYTRSSCCYQPTYYYSSCYTSRRSYWYCR